MRTQSGKLNSIGLKYKTDKSSLLHNYLDKYEALFSDPDSVNKVVEIGLQRGREWRHENSLLPSMRMWEDFFPNAEVFGFDIKQLKPVSDRMTILQGDQGSERDISILQDLIGYEVDLIIDDGSHNPIHQLHTFFRLFDNLRSGGKYIIEDCWAKVQYEYPSDCRIVHLITPLLKKYNHVWIDSKSAGPKSSLAIIKP